uniref:CATSPERD/E C-terminal domain-containing protein n=1 Tax=Branchiostoma floridae TaxID=7739 RepID=C3Z1J6_BRAFL|eukprot:XP_002597602.1 hypothetical protein BRAFLDRAFT_82295 [Branchiostoma floridae]
MSDRAVPWLDCDTLSEASVALPSERSQGASIRCSSPGRYAVYPDVAGYSAQLTELSWRKKQHPEVRQLHSSHVQHVLSKGTAYNRNSSLWEIVVEVDSSVEQALMVSGRAVLLDNCFVGLWEIVVEVDSSVEQALMVSGRAVLLDNCFVGTEVLFTQDSFLTTERLIIPDDVLQMDDECLAVWTTSQLFLKSSSNSSMELTSLPTAQLGAGGYNNNSVPILDVSFPSDPEELGVLVQVLTAEGESKVLTLLYDLSTTVWSLPESTREHSSAGNFSLLYLASAMPEALVWDSIYVTYFFSNGPNGDFVIHLTSNKLYYGRVDMENVVELSPGELPEAEFVLFFDTLGRLHRVNYDSTASSATARLFPLQAEVYSSMYPTTSCPTMYFSSNVTFDMLQAEKTGSDTNVHKCLHRFSILVFFMATTVVFVEKTSDYVSFQEVTYDLDNLGCPIDVFYSDRFRPTVDLYDGDQFVREVTEDYFVWEAHGRTGYGYNATMQQNYQPCSTPCDPPGSLSGQLEVLSSSGVSALTFGSSKGIFVFHLKVLDPECSYCILQTQFAVRVYGSPSESLELYVYLAVLAFIVGTVIILILTYYMYYKLMAKEHEKVLQEWTSKEDEEDQDGKEDGEEMEKEEEKEEM